MSRRISLTIVIVTLVAVVLFAVPLGIAVERRNHDAAILELERIATTAAGAIPVGAAASNAAVVLPEIEPDVHVALYGTDGERVAGTGPPTADAVVSAALAGGVHDGVVGSERVVAVPVASGDEVTGAVRASEPTAEVTDTNRRTWLAMAGLAVLVVGAAAVAATLLARRLTRPVRRLRDAAVRLGEGDFTVTPPLSGLAELDDAAGALAATAQHLGRLVERERAFSADASHELRTPLTSLRLTLEMELAQPRADASIAVNEALADVDRLEATLTNLLALARDVPDDRGPLAVTRLLQDARARWSRPLAAEGRSIVTETADATPVVHASATALATVIDVLVDNALHHGRGTVVVAARPVRPMGVSITVADEGALTGDANSVFDRRASEGGGHGIGLALARSLAHAEGCRLRLVQPAPTTFELLVVEAASRSAPEIAVR